MKKIILPALLVMFSCGAAIAQCDKKFVLTSSKTDYLDSSGTIQRSEDEVSTIELNDSVLTIVPGNAERTMSGPVKLNECNWKVPYKEGKTVVKASLSNQNGEPRDILITIEGKDGVITLLAILNNDQNRRVKLKADSFQEKK